MRDGFLLRIAASILILSASSAPRLFGQAPLGMGFRGPGPGMAVPRMQGSPAGFGFGGGSFPFPNLFMPFPGGYGYGYGGYDPIVASVPSAAYFTYGNTSYTTESPSPLPVYVPRPPFVPMPPPLAMTALLKVRVLPDAEVWLDGQKMRSTGPMRHYRTPPLDPTKEFAYEVRTRWWIKDAPVEEVRHIAIRAGATALVDFTHLDPLVPRPTPPAPPPSAAPPAKLAPADNASGS